MIKKLVLSAVVVFMMITFSVLAFADNISLYSNLDDSSSTCNLLVDIMRNDPDYDPYDEFVVCRTADVEYRLYFGPDLDNNSIKYVYRNATMGVPASITRSYSNSGLNITTNGYIYTGNISGASGSLLAEQYKTYYVITIVGICILLFTIFKIFRRAKSTGTRSYRVR